MIKLIKKNIKTENKIFFKSSLGNIQIFYIDKIFEIPKNVNINVKENNIYFKGPLGELSLAFTQNVNFFFKKGKLFLIYNKLSKYKKSTINLYSKLIKLKIKGVLNGFKLNLILKGIGFKAEVGGNSLILKLGFSHNIIISIPQNIKVIVQSNNLIFNSIDFISLTQFVYFVKSHKKPEPYKGKGLLLKDEIILKKEGKKK